ncbi:uncharacterized protein [Miscanthus floridulus]|uniref:uncharacterized protein n=1 Tax=Miscanthus floridulus TaxID=154761 RepID=UPI00345A44D8
MLDFYKDTCTGDIWSDSFRAYGDYDPMIAEAWTACAKATTRALTFPPPACPIVPELHDPVYADWDRTVELNDEASALGLGNVIHFGPGVQQMVDGEVVTTGITEQVTGMILEERRDTIVESMFMPCEQPVLDTPKMKKMSSKRQAKAGATKSIVGGLRRSTRQMAQESSVSVAKRATHRLIKAFGLVGPGEPIGVEALDTFAKAFGQPLTPDQVATVRKLTSLDNAAALPATAQLVAAEGSKAIGE